MKILMFTNTYTPHVGGVARSVSELAAGLRRAGDEVLVVAPEYGNTAIEEPGVRRIPAVQNFAGSDFSVPLPLSPGLAEATEAFDPDIIHSHHPFLLGDTALRTASLLDVPVVFTHHTRYELYGHYVAQDSELLKRLALSLSLGYCDLCDGVIAPSRACAPASCSLAALPVTAFSIAMPIHTLVKARYSGTRPSSSDALSASSASTASSVARTKASPLACEPVSARA